MTATAPAPVAVSRWGELPAERRLPGAVLRVLVAGESAGGTERKGSVWVACWSAGLTRSGAMRDRISEHPSAEEAVRAVIRSGWARRLGARASSPVHWTAQARRVAR